MKKGFVSALVITIMASFVLALTVVGNKDKDRERSDKQIASLTTLVDVLTADLPPAPDSFSLETQEYIGGQHITGVSAPGAWEDEWALYFKEKNIPHRCSVLYITNFGSADSKKREVTMKSGTPIVKDILHNDNDQRLSVVAKFGTGFTLFRASPPASIDCPNFII